MNPEDYKRVAETLEHYRDNYAGDQASREFDIAADLCERMARGELVERSELDALQEAFDELKKAALDSVDADLDPEATAEHLEAVVKGWIRA